MGLRKCLPTACAMETSLKKAETSFRIEKLLKVRLTKKCVTEKRKTSNDFIHCSIHLPKERLFFADSGFPLMLKLLVPQLKLFCTKNKIVLRHERKDSIVRTNCICGPSLYHMVHGTSGE